MSVFVIWLFILLSICIFGPFLRQKYIKRKCRTTKSLPGFRLKPIYALLEFIDWILRFFFRIHVGNIPKKKFIEEFQKTLDCSVLGNHQHLLLEGFQRYLDELDEIPLDLVSRAIIRTDLENLITTRQHTISCLKSNLLLASVRIETPLIIVGLPRTGTTMLYNLLSIDQSSFQSPKIWQMVHRIGNPTPSASKSDRRKTWQTIREQSYNVTDEMLTVFYASHPPASDTENDGPEEDVLILMHCFPSLVCPYSEWMLNDKVAKAYYEYHCNYFKMLQLDNPNNTNVCWLWKAPIHTLFIDSLLETYPDARLIITHRHPFEVIPSLSKLYAAYLRATRMPGTMPVKEVGRIAFHVCKTMIKRMEAAGFFLKNNPNVIHVYYSDLTNNPVDCVKRIYHQFGMPPISAELNMNFQLQSKINLQEKYGRMKYNLDEFGLSKHEIQTEFSTYISWLDTISTPSSFVC